MLTSHFQKKLAANNDRHLTRERRIIDKNSLINFCSNDYLSISSHPDVVSAFIRGAHEYGLGSGSSPLVSGYTKAHQLLEETFAEFLKRDRALLFNSGYHANLGVLTTFANRNSTIISDKLCHASIIDGIVLSRARHLRYRHNDAAHAASLLTHHESDNIFLVTESVFSMQGDIANIKRLSSLSAQHNGMIIVDDAHGIGVLGETGRGICELENLSQRDVPCLITPFGKAIGSMGAIVSGSDEMIETLLQFSRTYRYSTSLPPAICRATLAALKVLQAESWRNKTLQHLIQVFNTAAIERNLVISSSDLTPIKSIMIGANKSALELQNTLFANGFFVSCIRPPTVPTGSARIRISLNCTHSEEEIIRLLDTVKLYVERGDSLCHPKI